MRPLPPRSTRTDPLFPYPTLFRSVVDRSGSNDLAGVIQGSIEFSFRAPRAACAATRHRWAQLSHEPDTCQAQVRQPQRRSEEHTSELQSLMRISYAVLCLKKKKQPHTHITQQLPHTRLHSHI